MFAGGYGSGWSFSKCGHIWKRRCCFAKRGSLATCPTAVGESTRSKGTGVFWEIEILTAFPFFFHSKLIREGKTEIVMATLRLRMGCLYSWMNEAVMILNEAVMLMHNGVKSESFQQSQMILFTDKTACGFFIYLQIFPTGARFLPSTISNHVI